MIIGTTYQIVEYIYNKLPKNTLKFSFHSKAPKNRYSWCANTSSGNPDFLNGCAKLENIQLKLHAFSMGCRLCIF
jgi:hypothetical protein